jgi:hypothetical protein
VLRTSSRIRSKFDFNKIFVFFVRHFIYVISEQEKEEEEEEEEDGF